MESIINKELFKDLHYTNIDDYNSKLTPEQAQKIVSFFGNNFEREHLLENRVDFVIKKECQVASNIAILDVLNKSLIKNGKNLIGYIYVIDYSICNDLIDTQDKSKLAHETIFNILNLDIECLKTVISWPTTNQSSFDYFLRNGPWCKELKNILVRKTPYCKQKNDSVSLYGNIEGLAYISNNEQSRYALCSDHNEKNVEGHISVGTCIYKKSNIETFFQTTKYVSKDKNFLLKNTALTLIIQNR